MRKRNELFRSSLLAALTIGVSFACSEEPTLVAIDDPGPTHVSYAGPFELTWPDPARPGADWNVLRAAAIEPDGQGGCNFTDLHIELWQDDGERRVLDAARGHSTSARILTPDQVRDRLPDAGSSCEIELWDVRTTATRTTMHAQNLRLVLPLAE